MKELSIEEKAKAYDEAIEKAKEYFNSPRTCFDIEQLCNIFPELTQSDDERIRKEMIFYFQEEIPQCSIQEHADKMKKFIAWLEKQGEQKPADKIEPKFKVGDWVVYYRNDSSREVLQVYDIRDGRYYFNDNVHFSWSVKECDEKSHLWTIQDARSL
jgi:hypothetical protein